MSILFYRRPDYTARPSGPVNLSDCQKYAQRAKNSERAIPAGLLFEDVLSNKALPPCSLNDFMDYLVYVEFSAENLQFYLWYQNYVKRFEALPESEKALSPPWIPEEHDIPDLSRDAEKGDKWRMKRDGALPGFDGNPFPSSKEDVSTMAPSIISGSTVPPSDAEVTAQAGLKWQPFTIQPLRDEINRVMRHYLAFTAPRELNISHRDRAQCLHALQHTTHPSALEPAVKIAEAALRGQSHPNFIRWSICNGNKPRVFFVRTMGVSNIALGFLIAMLLALSHASRWWRIFAALEWFLGFSTMIASYKGLCLIMHHSHRRELRPWEQDIDSELGDARRNSCASTANRAVQLASRIASHENGFEMEDDVSCQPSSLQTFGPKNSFDDASWLKKYEKTSLLRKVFAKSTWTQDATLRVLQDKIVLGANLWAAIITIPLTALFVALPEGNFY